MSAGRVTVTGARGWIGGGVVRRLEAWGLVPLCVAHDSGPGAAADAAARADVVVHAGGLYSNARADFVTGNVEQAVALARGLSKGHGSVIFLSSVKVYGWSRAQQVADEDTPAPAPDNFSAAKRLAEELFAHAAVRSVLLRISNVYGRGIPAKYAVGTMLESARREGRVVLDCDGSSTRDFVHFDDVVSVIERAVLACLEASAPRSVRLGPGRHVFNVASGQPATLADVAGVFHEQLGAEVQLRGGTPVSSPRFANGKIIESNLAGAFTSPLEGVRALLRDWRSNPWDPH